MSRIQRNHLFIAASMAMAMFLVTMMVKPASGADAVEEVATTEAAATTEVVEEAAPEPEVEAAEPVAEEAPEAAPAEEPAAPATEVVNTTATGTKAKILKAPGIKENRQAPGGGGNPGGNNNNNNNPNPNPTNTNQGGGNATGYSVTYQGATYNSTADTTTFTWVLASTSNTDPASHVTIVTCLPQAGTTAGGTAGTATYGQDPSVDASPTGWKWDDEPAVGETFTLTVAGNMTDTGTASWWVKKGNDPDETSGTTNGPSCVLTAKVADVSIKKADNPDSVDIGDQIQYTLTVTNDGPDRADDVEVTDTLDADVTFDEFETGGDDCDHVAGVITCELGDLVDDQIVTITYLVTADGPAGTVTNTAEVTTTSTDNDTTDNTDTEDTEVKPVSTPTPTPTVTPTPEADVSITKTDSVDPVYVSGLYTYTLVATNNGPDPAEDVVVTDVLPASVTFLSYGYGTPGTCGVSTTPGTVVCDLDTLDVNESVTILINVFAPFFPSTVINTASITTTTAEEVTDNNSDTETTTVIEPPADELDLRIEKSDSADPFDIDDGNFVYTLVVTNDGPSDATDVFVVDQLPSGVDYVTNDSGCFYDEYNHDVFCTVGDLDAEDSVTINITVDPTEVGLLTNTASVDIICLPEFPGEGFPNLRPNQLQYEFPPFFCEHPVDTDPDNDSDTETTLVVDGDGIDLAISKTDHRNSIELGSGNLTYELVVTNVGDESAFNVVVEDELPDDADFVGFGGGEECSYDSEEHSVVCWLGTVTVEDTITITIEVTPTAVGTLVNNSEVHSLGQVNSRATANSHFEFFLPETNTDNNFASDSTVVTRFVEEGDPEADLSITKTDSEDPVSVGDDFSYTLNVFNHGPNTAQSVVITDVLPIETELISATSTNAGVACSSTIGVLGQDVITCHLSSLAANTAVQIDALVHAAAVGAVVNTASVVATTPDPNPSNNTDSEGTLIGEPPAGKGTIVIQKQTLPNGAAQTFSFTGDLTATLGDDESASTEVDPGVYTVTETPVENWELTRVECIDSDPTGLTSTGSVPLATAAFNVEEGETVTCVFTSVEIEVKGGGIGPPGPDGPDGPDGDGPDERPATKGRVLPFTGWTADGLPRAAIIMILAGLALLEIVRRRRVRG